MVYCTIFNGANFVLIKKNLKRCGLHFDVSRPNPVTIRSGWIWAICFRSCDIFSLETPVKLSETYMVTLWSRLLEKFIQIKIIQCLLINSKERFLYYLIILNLNKRFSSKFKNLSLNKLSISSSESTRDGGVITRFSQCRFWSNIWGIFFLNTLTFEVI